jgi:hypothetical protein
MSRKKWHRLPADGVGIFIGKDANARVFLPVKSLFARDIGVITEETRWIATSWRDFSVSK